MSSYFSLPFFRRKPALAALEKEHNPSPEHVRACLLEMARGLAEPTGGNTTSLAHQAKEALVHLFSADNEQEFIESWLRFVACVDAQLGHRIDSIAREYELGFPEEFASQTAKGIREA